MYVTVKVFRFSNELHWNDTQPGIVEENNSETVGHSPQPLTFQKLDVVFESEVCALRRVNTAEFL